MAKDLQIVSISPSTNFRSERNGFIRQDTEEFIIDIGQLAPREDVLELFRTEKSLPHEYDVYPRNKLMFCLPISIVQNQAIPNLWTYHVTWKTITNVQESIKDPTKQPAIITSGTYYQQENPDVDFNGKPLATTAGEPIDWPYQRGYPTYTIQKKLAQYPVLFGKNRDFVNNDDVSIYGIKYPPYSLFCPDVQIGNLEWQNGFPYFQFQAVLYVNLKEDTRGNIIGWRQLRRNAGYHERKFEGFKDSTDRSPSPTIYKTVELAKAAGRRVELLEPVFKFKAITLGERGKEQYPTQPVLLTPWGTAFRKKKPQDKQAALDMIDATIVDPVQKRYYKTLVNKFGIYPGSGDVLGLKVTGEQQSTSGITPQEWEQAVVEGVLYNLISFTDNMPLDAQDIPPEFRNIRDRDRT